MSGRDHAHGASAGRASARHLPRLKVAFGLTGVVFLVELVTALLTGSLALLSDAGHMLTDVAGLGMALAAISLASRGTSGGRHTFGLYRLEILAALANAALLLGVAAYVLWEAVARLQQPVEVPAVPMLVVATVGLVTNLVAFRILAAGATESLNVRGAYLEVLADLVGSAGVLVAAAVLWLTGWTWVDPVIGAAVGLFVVPRAVRLGRDALRVLVQAAPAHVDLPSLEQDLRGIDGVEDVHDLHVWTLTSEMDVASAHVRVDELADGHGVLDRARQLLAERHGIEHATIQVEPRNHRGCDRVGW